jgi:hypothetical protein
MNGFLLIRGVPALVLACVMGGCALTTDAPGSSDMAMPVGGNGGTGGGGTGGGGSGGTVQGPDDMAVGSTGTLPFAVDSEFVPSGYMGDGTTAGPVTMLPAKAGDSNDCNGQRNASSGAVGTCHTVTYAPPATNGQGWAGVYWQFPANNWGTKAGYSIPIGATKVTFSAKGSKGGEIVTFFAGGISGATNVYNDTVKASVIATLTSDWATYTIDLIGQSYTMVLGGFGWSMKASDATATSGIFYVDNIQWE